MPTLTIPRHVLRMADLSADELERLLELAARMKADPGGWTDALRGRALASFFEKPSTRTRASLAVAAHRLGMLPLALRPDELQLGPRRADRRHRARALGLRGGDHRAHVRPSHARGAR